MLSHFTKQNTDKSKKESSKQISNPLIFMMGKKHQLTRLVLLVFCFLFDYEQLALDLRFVRFEWMKMNFTPSLQVINFFL